MLDVFLHKFENKVSFKYYNAFCGLVSSYVDALHFLEASDIRTFEIFHHWYMVDGVCFFDDVVNGIQANLLDDRFIAFMELYKSYLTDAMEDDCVDVLLDFLYMIPKRMKEEFLKFRFIENKVFEYNFNFCLDMDT